MKEIDYGFWKSIPIVNDKRIRYTGPPRRPPAYRVRLAPKPKPKDDEAKRD